MSGSQQLAPILEEGEGSEGAAQTSSKPAAADKTEFVLLGSKERSGFLIGPSEEDRSSAVTETPVKDAPGHGRVDISSTLASIEEMLRQEKQFLESSKDHDLYSLIFDGIDMSEVRPVAPPSPPLPRDPPAKSDNVRHLPASFEECQSVESKKIVFGATGVSRKCIHWSRFVGSKEFFPVKRILDGSVNLDLMCQQDCPTYSRDIVIQRLCKRFSEVGDEELSPNCSMRRNFRCISQGDIKNWHLRKIEEKRIKELEELHKYLRQLRVEARLKSQELEICQTLLSQTFCFAQVPKFCKSCYDRRCTRVSHDALEKISSKLTIHNPKRVFFAALRCYAYKRVYIREQTRKFEVARARLLVSGGWKKWSDQANEKADLTKAIFNHLLRWSSRHRLDSIRGAFSVWAWASSVAAMASARATSMEEERRLQRSIVSESLTTLVAFHDPPGGQSVRQAADPGRGKQSAGPRTDPVVPGSGSNAPLSSLSSWKDPSGILAWTERPGEQRSSSGRWGLDDQEFAKDQSREDPSARLLSYYLREKDLRSSDVLY